MKKILLGLGTATAIVAPVTAVVACDYDSNDNDPNAMKDYHLFSKTENVVDLSSKNEALKIYNFFLEGPAPENSGFAFIETKDMNGIYKGVYKLELPNSTLSFDLSNVVLKTNLYGFKDKAGSTFSQAFDEELAKPENAKFKLELETKMMADDNVSLQEVRDALNGPINKDKFTGKKVNLSLTSTQKLLDPEDELAIQTKSNADREATGYMFEPGDYFNWAKLNVPDSVDVTISDANPVMKFTITADKTLSPREAWTKLLKDITDYNENAPTN